MLGGDGRCWEVLGGAGSVLGIGMLRPWSSLAGLYKLSLVSHNSCTPV